ncbi:uncharacterized protein LOC130898319 isoform X2 [Diorhabda carinulata]|uniref:uncharacterized protein LOC130898319 isoform X2 n=1 Tax=Diorhabda carinulata TaxID=1163345 RepID=UPI0025A16BC5|nr:uncharacterized protein LOC130898319 isoform X2 [Diorhabda carinulata]
MSSLTAANIVEMNGTQENSQFIIGKNIFDSELLPSNPTQLATTSKAVIKLDRDPNDTNEKISKYSASLINMKLRSRNKSAVLNPRVPSSIPSSITKRSKPYNNTIKSNVNKLTRSDSCLLRGFRQNISRHVVALPLLNKKFFKKQKPVLDVHKNFEQTKKKLEGIIASQKNIPKISMDICTDQQSKKNVIVELLDSIIKEVKISYPLEQMNILKGEKTELYVIINKQHIKVKEIVRNRQILVDDKKDSCLKLEALEEKLKAQKKLNTEACQIIRSLQRDIEEQRSNHKKYSNMLHGIINALLKRMEELELNIEVDKKNIADHQTRISMNSKVIKKMKIKIRDLENDKKNAKSLNTHLNKKLEQSKYQLKVQENMLQKLSDKSMSKCLIQIALRAFSEILMYI